MIRNNKTDFGKLNNFFKNYHSPEGAVEELTDIIVEYSYLAVLAENNIDHLQTAKRIDTLWVLLQELREAVR